jgi:senataxin
VNNLDGEQIVRDLLGSADVVFSTLVASGSMPISRMASVSALIVDEASACTEPEILIPLQKNPSRLLLVGDPKQLPAVITSPLASEYGLARSLQDRLMFNMKFDFILLNEQYRMRPEISKWPLNNFYDDEVQDGENVKDSIYKSDVSLLDGNPYSWVQVSAEEKKDKGLSTFNEGEAEAVISLLLEMKQRYKLTNAWFYADRLRVITFYHAQVNHINRLLRRYHLEDVTVSTVDASQGCEADIVVLSFVRGSSGHMGFLKDNRRLNVGLTRARFQLVCVGNLGAISYLDETGGHIPLVDLATDALSRVRVYKRPALPPPPGAKILDSGLSVTKSKKSRRKRAKAEPMGKSESG